MAEKTQITASGARFSAASRAEALRLPRLRLSTVIWFVVALILALTFFFPVFFMVTSSFKAENEIFAMPIHLFPQDFQGFTQYLKAFDQVPLGRFFFNSLLMASIDVVITVIFSAMAGYGFAKFKFRGQRLLFFCVLATITVPFQILIVPLYVQVYNYGWADTYAGLIIPGIMNAFGVFMMRQFAYALPDELLDAARIDGAGELRIFWRVVLPLLAPASASLAVIIFLFSWNNFLWPLIVIRSQQLQTIPVGMVAFIQPHNGQPQWAVSMAVSTMATLPVALLFIFFQRYFVTGLTMSGIKG
jgi:ABC-type glycerol-3-phosphate transport system permease component